MGKNILEPTELSRQGGVDRAAVEQIDPASPCAEGACCEAMLTADIIIMARAASSFWPTIKMLLPLCGRKTTLVGSLIEIASPSQAESALGASGHSVFCNSSFKSGFLATSAGRLPSKTIGGGF